MTIPADLLIHTVSRLRAPLVTDADNNQVRDWPNATSLTMTGRLQPDTAAERFAEGRNPDEETWTLFTNGTDIEGTDRIQWTGDGAHGPGPLTFQVHGPPIARYDGTTFHHHQVPLRILSG